MNVCVRVHVHVCVQSSSTLTPGVMGGWDDWDSGRPMIRLPREEDHMPLVDKIKNKDREKKRGRIKKNEKH